MLIWKQVKILFWGLFKKTTSRMEKLIRILIGKWKIWTFFSSQFCDGFQLLSIFTSDFHRKSPGQLAQHCEILLGWRLDKTKKKWLKWSWYCDKYRFWWLSCHVSYSRSWSLWQFGPMIRGFHCGSFYNGFSSGLFLLSRLVEYFLLVEWRYIIIETE